MLGDEDGDPALRALALTLPDERTLGQIQVQRGQVIDPVAIHRARQHWSQMITAHLYDELRSQYESLADGPYVYNQIASGRRALKNVCLKYIVSGPDGVALAATQYQQADNMTDRHSAIRPLPTSLTRT